MNPQRIQRKRTKGWRMPEGALYVGRGTMWGNPFVVEQGVGAWYVTQPGTSFVSEPLDDRRSAHETACKLYRDYILGSTRAPLIRSDLRGKNLACWCPLDMPCHADVLLEVANG